MRVIGAVMCLLGCGLSDAKSALGGQCFPTGKGGTDVASLVAACRADFNQDHSIDFADFFLFADSFQPRPDTSMVGDFRIQGIGDFGGPDLNDDGNVTFDDFFLFADQFGRVISTEEQSHIFVLNPTSVSVSGYDAGRVSPFLGCVLGKLHRHEEAGFFYSPIPRTAASEPFASVKMTVGDPSTISALAEEGWEVSGPDGEDQYSGVLPLGKIGSLSLEAGIEMIESVYDIPPVPDVSGSLDQGE